MMKKKILSILLAAVMVFSLLPVAALAAEKGNLEFTVTQSDQIGSDGKSIVYANGYKLSVTYNNIGENRISLQNEHTELRDIPNGTEVTFTLTVPEGQSNVPNLMLSGARESFVNNTFTTNLNFSQDTVVIASLDFGNNPGGPGPGGQDDGHVVKIQITNHDEANGSVQYKFNTAQDFTTVTAANMDDGGNIKLPIPAGATTITFKAEPSEGHVIQDCTILHDDQDIDEAKGYVNGVKGDGYEYTLPNDEKTIVFRADFGNELVMWNAVSWDGGNVKVENGQVKAYAVHVGDKTYDENAKTADATNKLYPLSDITEVDIQTHNVSFLDTDLFISENNTENISIDFRFIPDYGYQVTDIIATEGSVMGQFDPGTEISTFNFAYKPGTNVHFIVKFTKTDDIINKNSSIVSSAAIENGGNAIDSGNLKMGIADVAPENVSDGLKNAVGETDAQYLDMTLSQVVSKTGTNGDWENQLTELNGAIDVSLTVTNLAPNEQYVMIREHTNGYGSVIYDEIPVTYDSETNTITFATDKFSTYALVKKSASGAHIHVTGADAITFEAWTDATKLPETAKNYYLDTDVTLNATWNVPEDTTNLCLNGHVIKMGEGATGSVITVPANATLNLYDCSTTKHDGYVDTTGLWHLGTGEGTAKTVTGGVITGGNASGNSITLKNGGGINVSGTFTMNGGNIVGNAATNNGGGVYNSGTFNMNGGGIVGNTASEYGGGVYVNNGAFTTMYGGTVAGNASHQGGGVYADSTSVTLGGTVKIIENFRANNSADNFYVVGNKQNTIKPFSLGGGVNAPKAGMHVGIKMQKSSGGEFTANAIETQVGCFTSDDSTFGVRLSSTSGIELAKLYAITTGDITNGTITTNATENKAFAGDTVTITVTPSSGYQLKANTLKATYDENGETEGGEESCKLAGTGNTYTFTMPAYAVTVSAEFERIPTPSSGGSSSSTITVPVSGDANSVKISATVSGSTATVKEIKDADLAKVTGGESVEIDLTGLKKDIDAAKIPTSTVEKIGEQAGMSVKLSTATVTFDQTATQEISAQAGGKTIELVVDDVKEVSLNAVQKEAVKKLDTAIIIDAHLVSNGMRLCSESDGGFGGGKATVALPYEIKNNRTAANYTVFYVDDAGKLEKLKTVYDKELAAFVFEIEHFSVYVVAYDDSACAQGASCPIAIFIDAKPTEWYHDGVHFCLENGYMNGVGNDHFAPNGTLSRAMIVTMLWRLEGKPVVNYAMSFKDVKADQWYTEAIRWAQSTGVVEGYNADSFGPDDDVTREQLATILYRYAKYKDIDTDSFTKDTNTLSYTDVFTISDWANAGMHFCIAAGVVSGNGDMLYPTNTATRAEAATMFQRFCEKVLSK